MVATDSYRLSVKETTLEPPLAGGFEANVPARALQELARIAGQPRTSELSVSVRQNQVVFELGGAVLSSRLIDGQFPNYRQLLPESFEHELRIAGEELTDVVRRISLLAQKNAPLRLASARASSPSPRRRPTSARRGDAAGGLPGRGARDRLQPGVPARRPRERRDRRRAC